MKKYILPIFAMIAIAAPSQAHADFLLGYMVGQSVGGSRDKAGGSRDKAAPASGIPPACFYADNLPEYQKCRIRTAWDIYSNDPQGTMNHFMQIEYENIILPMQKQDKQQPK